MSGPSAKAEQKERRALAGSTTTTTKDATTLHQLANLDGSLTGRFNPGGYVSGSEPVVNYPAASGPWSGPQPGPEPPLGFDVNAMEPVGEPFEVQRSLAGAEAPMVSCSTVVETAPATPNPEQRRTSK
jgi:hypothetical protein